MGKTDPPQRVTPSPTVPPPAPAPEPVLESAAKRVDWSKAILGAVGLVFLSGMGVAVWEGKHATKEDVAHEREMSKSSVDALESEVRAQVSTLEAEARMLERQAAVLSERVATTEKDLDWLKAGVFELLKRQGAASAVPPPPP